MHRLFSWVNSGGRIGQIELTTYFHRLYWGGARSRAGTLHQLTSNLSGKKNLAGLKPGASDYALFSVIVNLKMQGDLSSEVTFLMEKCSDKTTFRQRNGLRALEKLVQVQARLLRRRSQKYQLPRGKSERRLKTSRLLRRK